jgi:prolyl-tRNA synthetase
LEQLRLLNGCYFSRSRAHARFSLVSGGWILVSSPHDFPRPEYRTLPPNPMPPKTAIQPTRSEDFPEWYQQVIKAADLAENSETRGCMVIKPWGYGIWEQIQQQLDKRFKETGHQNAYFPLLIPLSYLEKEAQHAEGFATECAVVTHHRLETVKDEETGKTRMIPTGELAEPYVIRPTSETIIGAAFSRWVQSYRDLPLLINQWANVMRWEMRPRLFLRTAEFLWQEGHTAHESEDEAVEETRMIHRLYEAFLRNNLAIPVIAGEKTENERFPGADMTLTIEAMVQDKKAIQAGTSHYLGQNFSKAQDISFTGRDGKVDHAHTTSWGVSTRLIGTLIMAHSDDDGLVCPPRVATQQIVIIPVTPKENTRDAVLDACQALAQTLRGQRFHDEPLRVHVDARDVPGKKWEWVKKGVPVRIEIGPRDLESRKICLQRRDKAANEKAFVDKEDFIRNAADILQEIHDGLLATATSFRDENILECSDLEAFHAHWKQDNPGWLLTPWAGSSTEENVLSKEHRITVRCLPLGMQDEAEVPCLVTGKPAKARALWGRSY